MKRGIISKGWEKKGEEMGVQSNKISAVAPFFLF